LPLKVLGSVSVKRPHVLLVPSAGPMARRPQDVLGLDVECGGDARAGAVADLVGVDVSAGDTEPGERHAADRAI